MILTKDALLAPRTKRIDVDGGSIVVKALEARYAVSLRGRNLGDADIFDMLAHSICEPEMTAEEVGRMPLTLLQPILDGVMEFNALSEGKAVDDLKKTPASASHTP